MKQLTKQIKLLEHEIDLEKAQLFQDYAVLREKIGTTPNLIKGFLWGLSLGFLVIAPKLKHTSSEGKKVTKHSLKKQPKEPSIHRLLLGSLPTLLKFL